jgi:hypothetical protein
LAAARDHAASMDPTVKPNDPPWLTEEQLKFLAAPDTCPNAIVAKALPARPAWVDEAFANSIAVLNEKFAKRTPDGSGSHPEQALMPPKLR